MQKKKNESFKAHASVILAFWKKKNLNSMVRLDYTIKLILKIYLWRTYLFMFGFLRDIIIIFIAFPLLPVIKQPSISNLKLAIETIN